MGSFLLKLSLFMSCSCCMWFFSPSFFQAQSASERTLNELAERVVADDVWPPMPDGDVEQDHMLEPVSVEQLRVGGQGQVAAAEVADALDDANFDIRSKELRADLSNLTTCLQDRFQSDLLHVSSFHRMPLQKWFVGFVFVYCIDAVMCLIISAPAPSRRRTFQGATTH